MRLTVVGCGDAFGSGGRLQTAYHVDLGRERLLIDCGATTLIGLARQGLRANDIGTIVISHLHGDHYAGLVWWLLHGQHVAKRQVPLRVLGPAGIEARFIAAAEALFPGSTKIPSRFPIHFEDMTAGSSAAVAGGTVMPFEVRHPSGAASHALRFEIDGKVLAFSGDTEWVEAVVACGQGADLFMVECYMFDGSPRYHMSWQQIAANLPRIGARKVMLTHMSDAMLARRGEAQGAGIIHAEDGLVVDV